MTLRYIYLKLETKRNNEIYKGKLLYILVSIGILNNPTWYIYSFYALFLT